MDLTLISQLTFYGAALTSFGGLVWFISSQFNGIRKLCYEIKEQILNKLEYHEKHDDERFTSVSKELWEIRLRNAAIDGKALLKRSEERVNHT